MGIERHVTSTVILVALRITHNALLFLGLSGCLIEKAGFFALVPALTSNDSHMKELDVSYNHPGPSGVELLQTALNLTHRRCRLDILRIQHKFFSLQ
ncbi:unnamed protein product [Menidia menidia]|uniref:(Atlantic silverside) hypothetical protein n=1 Tax=Menidia menidia TaxID=238744 RepID=A0A8S4B915_9TELE|nr:unnamed protein product [Menidia menidia]